MEKFDQGTPKGCVLVWQFDQGTPGGCVLVWQFDQGTPDGCVLVWQLDQGTPEGVCTWDTGSGEYLCGNSIKGHRKGCVLGTPEGVSTCVITWLRDTGWVCTQSMRMFVTCYGKMNIYFV